MSFIRKVNELFGDKSSRRREEFCSILQNYGVETRLAEKRRMEEDIDSDRGRFISGGLT
jgi:hypothetical protein